LEEDMTLRVVGAGLGRTGTNSLKVALEALLDGPCYHMFELVQREQDTAVWAAAERGEDVDWASALAGYVATVDWPAAAFWRELLAANPEALVLLSIRESAERWWASVEKTILVALNRPAPPDEPATAERRAVTRRILESRLARDWQDPAAAMAGYERHNQAVREAVAPERLIEWQPGEGWEPICSALGVPLPDIPFPHENTTADFRARLTPAGD
jgi:hypothetical protein